jgi:hypothetical protein
MVGSHLHPHDGPVLLAQPMHRLSRRFESETLIELEREAGTDHRNNGRT